MRKPLVSIIMPVFNCENTIKSSIHSLFLQTYSEWELLIVDDCSTDNTLKEISALKSHKMKLYRNTKNEGLAWCLNFLIDLSQGDYIVRMDGDDIAAPKRLEKQVEYLQKNPNCDLVGSRALIFEDNSPIGFYPFRESHEVICKQPLKCFFLPHPTWMGRKEWFFSFRYDPAFKKAEDYDLLLRSYRFSCFHCLRDVLIAYRQGRFGISKYLQGKIFFFKAHSNEMLRSELSFLRLFVWFCELLKLVFCPIMILLYLAKIRKIVPTEDSSTNSSVPLKQEIDDIWLHVFSPLLESTSISRDFLDR